MKKKILLFLSIVFVFSGCGFLNPAPLFDGAYLKYQAGTEQLTIKFSKVNSKYFELTINSSSQYFNQEDLIRPQRGDDKVLVDKFMKRPNGRYIQLQGVIGPIWVPKNLRREGSQEGVDLIFQGVQSDKIKQWKGLQVYAVAASVFRGAVSGEWYFDPETGFLVGCKTKTIVSDMFFSDDDTPTLILIETNIQGLSAPGQSKDSMLRPTMPHASKKIKIDAIMISGDEQLVMIDGEFYNVGDVIHGVKILAIMNDRIKVQTSQGTEIIR